MNYASKYRYEIRDHEEGPPIEEGVISFKDLYNWAIGDTLLPYREVKKVDEVYDQTELWARILVDNLREGREGYDLLGSPEDDGSLFVGGYDYSLTLKPVE